jgi:hypothetical protein
MDQIELANSPPDSVCESRAPKEASRHLALEIINAHSADVDQRANGHGQRARAISICGKYRNFHAKANKRLT